ncbi:hypothetical protein TKV_c19760 [Thermoanaerobacter kivui]|uniref:Phosphohydrolase n=1 Tax=Thermoanaerobacter kivui TaxID=2325 RepID=A0A097ATF6_THEKI|nr:hypothetical protein [Thermoanaerobacter kivui]AIS53120.1 hypothetical protein TKV_c19760 [Thermoanaerobacter kivui]
MSDMSEWKCPGQDRSFWKITDIFESNCPHCGGIIEFWKDDITVKCPRCKKIVVNPKFDPGCAAWCEYADKCLGSIADDIQSHPDIIKTRLKANVRKYFLEQPELMGLSLKAGEYAEKLAEKLQVSPLIPIVAAYCHKIAEKDVRQELAQKVKLPIEIYEKVEKLLSGEGDEKESSIIFDAIKLADLHHKTLDELNSEFDKWQSELRLSETRELAQKIYEMKKNRSQKKN